MMEAENLARLRQSQTPLLGGENPELHPSYFSGVTPRKREIQTPNPMATPLMSPGPTGLIPRIGGSHTNSRDQKCFRLQRELPRPPSAALDVTRNLLMWKDEDKSSFVPPTLFQKADEMINKELLALLEHDNANYPFEEKTEKEKKKGEKRAANGKPSMLVPEIEDFEEDELKEVCCL
ncbi:uncharacterized protein A4U43_UnF700 [Asparagus officinalis]|uniref:Pre-mRNA splicing factor component Cdc5p/Cef1 C-terminal domain-containing protein n=1 Tax=Asparagus officinalis TaxID=4686 RepID=A0A1R3L7Q6_ASPOF|nr:uncharacterized protein A4U43_UnF700 [Asparagus officinalis]